jgi:hypothetical protein
VRVHAREDPDAPLMERFLVHEPVPLRDELVLEMAL